MNRVRRFCMPLALVLLVPVLAGAAPAEPKDNATILPYLDEGTFVIARLDVERVDQEALGKYAEQSIDAAFKVMPIPANQQAMAKTQFMAGFGAVKTFLTDLAAAGGKHVYVLFDVADARAGNDEPVIIVPLGEGADAERIREVLSRDNDEPGNVVEVGKAVVFAQPGVVERLKNRMGAKPVDMPDLPAAMSAAGDVPLRFAIVPGESARAWVEESVPELPEPLGGGDTKVLSRGIRYATIAIAQKPATMANLTVRCADAEKAKAVLEVMNKGLGSLSPAATQDADDNGEDAHAHKKDQPLKPKLAGDTITVSADPVMLIMRMNGLQATAEVDVDDAPAAPAQPPKKDDGGL